MFDFITLRRDSGYNHRMKLYEDKFGLYNDSPVKNGEPSGNDGPILTAFAEKAGLPLNREKILDYWHQLPGRPIPSQRLPGKDLPPPSRDSILGWFWLGFIDVDVLKRHHWNFSPWELPARNIFKTIHSLWKMRHAHRNKLWQDGGEPYLWRYAFSVPWHDRAYLLRESGKPIPFLYRLAETIYKFIGPRSASSRRIYWRKYHA